jgi:hypothetical protein
LEQSKVMAKYDLKPESEPSKYDLVAEGAPSETGVAPVADESNQAGNIIEKTKQYGSGGLSYAAKLADMLRGGITAPILGKGIEAATGKKVFNGKDWVNAINPTTMEKFPTSNEMMERAGVPEGSKLSDVVGGYAEPSPQNPWFQPEKGGMLDPTIRGTGGTAIDIAIDPLTYLTSGAAAAGKKGIEAGAVARAMAKNPVAMEAPAKAGLIGRIGMAPQKAIGYIGNKFYNTPIDPILAEGTKKGKKEIEETLFRAGLKNPTKTQEVAEQAMQKLGEARNNIAKQAEEKGAVVKLEEMLDPLKKMREKLAKTRSPETDAALKDVDARIKYFEDAVKPTKGTPKTVVNETSNLVDAAGNPIQTSRTIEATPDIPGRPIGPEEGTRIKTAANYRKSMNTPNIDQQIANAQAVGAQKAVENSIGESLGGLSKEDYKKLNEAWGGLLGTKQGQATAEARAHRLLNHTLSPTGTGNMVGAIGAGSHGSKGWLTATMVHKLGQMGRAASMPLGYGMKKFGESSSVGPAFDVWAKAQLEKEGKPVKKEEEK